MSVTFFSRYPREVMFNRKRILVRNVAEFLKLYNTYAPVSNFYISVYSYEVIHNNGRRDKPVYESAVVNKVYFDFDGDNAHDNMLKLHRWCRRHDVLHTVVFSGGGYHVYLLCAETNKQAVRTFQHYINDKLPLNLDSKHISFFGDVARVTRVPNSYNHSRGVYCIPLQPEQLRMSFDEHLGLAARAAHNSISFMGNKLLDINAFTGVYEQKTVNTQHVDSTYAVCGNNVSINIDKLPACIKSIIQRKKSGWSRENGYTERRVLICYAREVLGLDVEQCNTFMRSVLTEAEYRHMCSETSDKYGQLSYIYSRGDVFMPSCRTLREWGYCNGNCR